MAAFNIFPFSGSPRRPEPPRKQPVPPEKQPIPPEKQSVPENPIVPGGQPGLPEESSEPKGPRPGAPGRPRRLRFGFPRPPGR